VVVSEEGARVGGGGWGVEAVVGLYAGWWVAVGVWGGGDGGLCVVCGGGAAVGGGLGEAVVGWRGGVGGRGGGGFELMFAGAEGLRWRIGGSVCGEGGEGVGVTRRLVGGLFRGGWGAGGLLVLSVGSGGGVVMGVWMWRWGCGAGSGGGE